MAIVPDQMTLGLRRQFTTAGVHPYEEVDWERRDARIVNALDGTVAFEQLDVEVPAEWSTIAVNILAQKYFRGAPGTDEREQSLAEVIDRVVGTIVEWGTRDGYFATPDEAQIFRDELTHLLVTQKAAFNSPVWFNIGVDGVPQQASACFILSVDDTMPSILEWYVQEGTIFKGGSGSGVNLSRIDPPVSRSPEAVRPVGRSASCAVPMPRPARSRAAARRDGRPRWSCSTATTPTCSTSSGARPAKSGRLGRWPRPVSTWGSTESTPIRSSTRTPTTRSGWTTPSCERP